MNPVVQSNPVSVTTAQAVAPRQSWWRSALGRTPTWVPRSVRQFQLKSLASTFWWLRTWHPWSAFALVLWFWLGDRDRRLTHQVRLQRLVFQQVNFRDVEVMLADFIRPELWML
jgi:hypothetical protein